MSALFDTHKPFRLVLAADARLAAASYTDDQIWELTTYAQPAALCLQTTYGLRARSMRIFPTFTLGRETSVDPLGFPKPPRLIRAYPNLCSLAFSPFEDLDVLYEVWVPESQVITGKVKMGNLGSSPLDFRFEMSAELTPIQDGQALTPIQEQVTTILHGRTSRLYPILFLTGGPDSGKGSYPGLGVEVHLEPGEYRTLSWASAALHSDQESFEMARRATARPWEAELSRIELTFRSTQLEIESGNPIWDEIFRLAQNQAQRLLVGPTSQLPGMSFVLAREPDHGFPGEDQGASYGPLWNGQSVFHALGLSQVLLPGSEEIVQGWVRNQLSTQDALGRVDWKPGLAGQRGRLLAQPALATLALRASRGERGGRFLAEVYPNLFRYIQNWFNPEHDRDGDGFPEWEHDFQVGFEDQPLFDAWKQEGAGIDITTVESPALAAWLYQECASLGEIARQIGHEADLAAIDRFRELLSLELQACWDEAAGRYAYRDRDLHQSSAGEVLYQGSAWQPLPEKLLFDRPVRLQIHIREEGATTHAYRVKIQGERLDRGQVEMIKLKGIGQGTSQMLYTSLDEIEVEGAWPGSELCLSSPGLDGEDLSLYLPLWAGIPSPEQANRMLHALKAHYLGPFGLSQLPAPAAEQKISPFWNALIVEGLLRYGFETEAQQILVGLMRAFEIALTRQGNFYQYYQAADGLGRGIVGHLEGLPPLGVYLKSLGLEINSPWRVLIQNSRSLPVPFTVKYRGMRYTNQDHSPRVIFPDGQSLPVDRPGEYRLSSLRGKHSPPN